MKIVKRQAKIVINYELGFDHPNDKPRIAVQNVFVNGEAVERKTEEGDIAITHRWPIEDNFYDGLYVEHTSDM